MFLNIRPCIIFFSLQFSFAELILFSPQNRKSNYMLWWNTITQTHFQLFALCVSLAKPFSVLLYCGLRWCTHMLFNDCDIICVYVAAVYVMSWILLIHPAGVFLFCNGENENQRAIYQNGFYRKRWSKRFYDTLCMRLGLKLLATSSKFTNPKCLMYFKWMISAGRSWIESMTSGNVLVKAKNKTQISVLNEFSNGSMPIWRFIFIAFLL